MIRLITFRRLVALEDEIRDLGAEVHRVRQAGQAILMQQRLAEQARDHYREQAEFWKTRAARFIDQEHLKSGTIDSPVMGEAAPPPQNHTQRIMAALNTREIHKHKTSEEVPQPAAILGVDEAAARAAVAGALDNLS